MKPTRARTDPTLDPSPASGLDKIFVRLPEGMRDRLAELARRNGRSANAEAVQALAAWLGAVSDPGPPRTRRPAGSDTSPAGSLVTGPEPAGTDDLVRRVERLETTLARLTAWSERVASLSLHGDGMVDDPS